MYFNKALVFTALCLLIDFGSSFAQTASQTFGTAGTYTFTVPTGVTSITVQAWGGGGGARGDGTDARGGGGGGAYASSVLVVTPGQTFTVVVGAGGTATSNPGQSGQNAVFGNDLVIAAGGTGGTNSGGAGGTVAASIGTTRFAGGTGGSRSTASGAGGGGGGSAFATSNGNNGANASGNTGGAGGTGAGNGGNGGNVSQPGNAGLAPGGGGGARGANGGASGNGAVGRVVVSWASPTADLAVTKTANASQLFVGQAVTFTVTASNNGSANASSVVVNDQLPSGFTFISATLSSSTASYNSATGVLTIGTLNVGNSVTMNLVGIVNSSGTYTNTASVTADQPDSNSANNSASATITVCRAGSSSPSFN